MPLNPIFARILESKRAEVEHAKRIYPENALRETAQKLGARRSLREAFVSKDKKAKVIAEIKRSTPSVMLKPLGFDPVKIARSYEAGGAVALSVLTDAMYFCGSPGYLPIVREAVSLPVLRKDFIIDSYQITEAAAWGADAVLLMGVNFDREEDFAAAYKRASDLGLEVLVEIHSEAEWEKVKPMNPNIVGINNRDFLSSDLKVDLKITVRLAPLMPEDVVVISESGITSAQEIVKLSKAGADGFLIGTGFMKEDDPGAALSRLLGEVGLVVETGR